MAKPSQLVCVNALFRGRVQGVGFRYTTERIAHAFAVTGFVRNLPDGRVEVQAEGEPAEVHGFIEEIETRMKNNIRERTAQEGPATGQYPDFSILF
ncbi:MAG: acylphosphatase [Phycisphaerales bacterium]|nr:acylphosphatase [Phycisphaerales bacterium]